MSRYSTVQEANEALVLIGPLKDINLGLLDFPASIMPFDEILARFPDSSPEDRCRNAAHP